MSPMNFRAEIRIWPVFLLLAWVSAQAFQTFAAVAAEQLPPPDGESKSPTASGQSQYQERLQRLGEIRAMTERQLIGALGETCMLGAESGLPLLREASFYRVALEHLQLEIDDLSSIREIQHAEELLRRPDFQAQLRALLSNPEPKGLKGLLDDHAVTLEDLQLLADLVKARARREKYKAQLSVIKAQGQSLAQAASRERGSPGPRSRGKFYEEVEKHESSLREASAPLPRSTDTNPELNQELMDLLKNLVVNPEK